MKTAIFPDTFPRIRLAVEADIPEIMALYHAATDKLLECEIHQWDKEVYPTKDKIEGDIAKNFGEYKKAAEKNEDTTSQEGLYVYVIATVGENGVKGGKIAGVALMNRE